MPGEVWSVITDYLDDRALWTLASASPYTYALLHSPRVVGSLSITLRYRSTVKITSWPTQWLSTYPSINSFSLRLNNQSSAKLTSKDLKSLGERIQHLFLHYNDNMSDAMLPYLPPFLKTLHLTGNYCITDDGFAHLPETLESLHLPTNRRLSSSCLLTLPQGLTSLSLRTKNAIDREHMAAIPRGLTDLTLKGAHPPAVQALALLPPELSSFNWDFDSSYSMGVEEAAALPWTLRTLIVLSMSNANKTLSALPRSITKLVIRSEDGIEADGTQGMPPHLTHLELTSNRSFPASAVSHLPRWLSTLALPSNVLLKPADLLELPKSLTALRMPLNTGFSDSQFLSLPSSLDTLACCWNDSISSQLVYYVPGSLKRLELRAHHTHEICSKIQELSSVKTAERIGSTSQYNTFTLHLKHGSIAQAEVSPKFIPNFSCLPPRT